MLLSSHCHDFSCLPTVSVEVLDEFNHLSWVLVAGFDVINVDRLRHLSPLFDLVCHTWIAGVECEVDGFQVFSKFLVE